jgi:23S rRNA (pseudouridine1915-N3)-methyltransferase
VKLTVLAVGRIRAPFAAAEQHYVKLIRPREKLEVVEVKDDQGLVRRVSREHYVVALDPEGSEMDSIAWSDWLAARRMAGRDVTLVIGGPEGLPRDVLASAAERVSLGRHTLAHQLARIVLLEQIFRAGKILAGEKYHL